MKICILGCGAIGGIYGAHLARHPGVEVWAYDKDEEHVSAINRNGLQIVGVTEFTATVRATLKPDEIPNCDFGIIATKTYHTRPAIEATAHLFKNGAVCSFQNGAGNEEIIAEYVSDVISGTAMPGGHVSAPGIVNFDTNGMSWIGLLKGGMPEKPIRDLANILTDEGLETQYVSDPRSVKWSKLIFNAAANPLCALTDLPFGEVYNDARLRKLMYGLAEEGVEVAKALGIELETDPIELLDKASQSAGAHLPSMLSDVRCKRRTEVDALNGGIAGFGAQVDVPCPLNESMIALIKGVEAAW